MDLPDHVGAEHQMPPATPPPDLSYGFFRRSAKEAATLVQDRMNEGDVESAELLIRVKDVWESLAACLQHSNNAHTEREIGRLFCDHCVFLVNFVNREAQSSVAASRERAAGLEADFKVLSEGMHKLLLRKAETQRQLRELLAVKGGGGPGGCSPGSWEKYEDETELLAGKIVNCNRTMRQIALQLEEVMDEQAALGRSKESRMEDMVLKHSCSGIRDRLRARSAKMVRETRLAMADVEASQSSLLQMQEHAEVEVLEKQEAGMRVVEELRAARTNMDQTRADLGAQLLQVLQKLQELEVRAAHLHLQEEAVSDMLKLNAERVRQGRARVSAQVAVFEKRRNDLQQRVHALELLEDRGAALLDTISVVLSARSKAMADCNLNTLLLHHKTDSAIFLHADVMLRHHVQQEEEALARIAELEALQANQSKCSGTSSLSVLIPSHERGHVTSSAQSWPLCCPGNQHHAQEREMELLRWERQKCCSREEVLEARELQQHFDRRCSTSAAAVVLQCNRLRRLSREGGSLLLRAGAFLVRERVRERVYV
jgi:hypothetical protein